MIEKVLLQYKMEKMAEISKKPQTTLEGVIHSQSGPEASIPTLIHRGQEERELQQHSLARNTSSPGPPGQCASHRLDAMNCSDKHLCWV